MKHKARLVACSAASFLLASCSGGGSNGVSSLPRLNPQTLLSTTQMTPHVSMTAYHLPSGIAFTPDGGIGIEPSGAAVFTVTGTSTEVEQLLNGRFSSFPTVPPKPAAGDPPLLQYNSDGALALNSSGDVYSALQFVVNGFSPELSTFDGMLAYTPAGAGKFIDAESQVGSSPSAAAGAVDSASRYWTLFNTGNGPIAAITSGAFTSAPAIHVFSVGPRGGSAYFGNAIAHGTGTDMWIATTGLSDTIVHVASTGATLRTYPIATGADSFGIAVDPSGNVWFTDYGHGKIGRLNPNGTSVEFPIPTANSGPRGITLGGDGAMWFTETNTNKIGRITSTGQISEYTVPVPGAPTGIAGPAHVGGCGPSVLYVTSRQNTVVKVTETF